MSSIPADGAAGESPIPISEPLRASCAARAGLLLLVLLAAAGLHAASLELEVGVIDTPGWRASDLHVALRPVDQGLVLELELPRLGTPAGELGMALGARCSAVGARPSVLECGSVSVRLPGADREQLHVDGRGALRILPDGFELRMESLAVGAGHGSLELVRRGAATSLELSLQGVDAPPMAAIQRLLAGPGTPGVNAGRLGLQLTLAHDGERLHALDASLRARGIGFSDDTGLNAGEGVDASLRLTLADARLDAELLVDGGQVYLHPVFLDLAGQPVGLQARGSLAADGAFELPELRVAQSGVVTAIGSAVLSAGLQPRRFRLDVDRTPVAPVVGVWLQPWLPAELADGVEAAGEFAAGISWQGADDIGVRLDLYDAALGDAQARFALYGLEGRLQWHSRERRAVTLRTAGAELYRLQFGPTHLVGEVEGRGFTLLAPLRVPLFGGALRVDALQADGVGTAEFEVSLAGELEPVELRALTGALDWPAFGGSLSGTLPDLRYSNGVLALGSELRTQVFDGEVVVDDLRIEDPLGVVPVLRADVRVADISLGALTEVFAFGKVTGRLQGEVLGLVLRDWQPRAFDARFLTPEGDRTEHRISQRAVNNLASIGGATGVLSAGFLGIFSEFSYDRLGLSCVLRNGVCRMGGVVDAQQGYHIVVGGGLPRIDVVGYNRDVDWSVLVERLIQATRSDGPVVR